MRVTLTGYNCEQKLFTVAVNENNCEHFVANSVSNADCNRINNSYSNSDCVQVNGNSNSVSSSNKRQLEAFSVVERSLKDFQTLNRRVSSADKTANRYSQSNSHGNSHSNSHGNSHGNSQSNSHSNSDGNSHSNSDGNSHSNSDGNSDRIVAVISEKNVDRELDFPLKGFKNLQTEFSWRYRDYGWKDYLQKSYFRCQSWLDQTLTINGSDCNSLDAVQMFVNEELYQSCKTANSSRILSEKRSKLLQQYFASDENIALLVELTLSTLKKNSNFSANSISDSTACGNSRDSVVNNGRVVFLEPSFGDGRIIDYLTQTGVSEIVGCEIDETVATNFIDSYHNNHSIASNCCCEFFIQDYLQLKRAQVQCLTGDEQLVVIGGPPYKCVISSNCADTVGNSLSNSVDGGTMNKVTQCSTILNTSAYDIVSGSLDNPCDQSSSKKSRVESEQSLGTDRNIYLDIDYPHEFIKHSVKTMKATMVAFILPERCRKQTFMDTVLQELNTEEAVESNGVVTDKGEWVLDRCVEANNKFYILNREISQPSVIMIWKKVLH